MLTSGVLLRQKAGNAKWCANQQSGFNQWNLRLRRCGPTIRCCFQSAGRIHRSENNFRIEMMRIYSSVLLQLLLAHAVYHIGCIPLDWAAVEWLMFIAALRFLPFWLRCLSQREPQATECREKANIFLLLGYIVERGALAHVLNGSPLASEWVLCKRKPQNSLLICTSWVFIGIDEAWEFGRRWKTDFPHFL